MNPVAPHITELDRAVVPYFMRASVMYNLGETPTLTARVLPFVKQFFMSALPSIVSFAPPHVSSPVRRLPPVNNRHPPVNRFSKMTRLSF